jgi:hypothetical protein
MPVSLAGLIVARAFALLLPVCTSAIQLADRRTIDVAAVDFALT